MSIIGVGLLGGSIGLAAKSLAKPWRVVGYGHRRSTLQRALETGAIDEAADDLGTSVRKADLVILATPVGLFEEMLRGIADYLPSSAVVTDVGSTKRSVVALAEKTLPKGVAFVGSHPMAGSEKRGVEYARTDLCAGAICILTPNSKTSPSALADVEGFWESLGMRPARLTPEDHDRLLADISHLPHALAASLVAMQSEEALPLAGKGFLDTTRIAGGDGGLWRDILLDNRDNLLASIKRLKENLDRVAGMLKPGQADALAAWLNESAARREELVRQKLREINPD